MFKSIAFSLIAVMATASVAQADSFFQDIRTEHDRVGHVELGLVRADQAGIVELYDYHLGEIGELLGTVDVHAGANPDVFVNIARPTRGAMAVLRIGGQIVDTEEVNFN